MIDSLESMRRRDEDEVLHAYPDSEGYWTIGIGRLIDERKGGGISKAESSFLFSNDTAKVDAQVRASLPWAQNLDPVRRAALLNMCFQMGVGGLLGFKNSLELIRTGQYQSAARNMLQSLWAKQTPARAMRVAKQIETGVWQ